MCKDRGSMMTNVRLSELRFSPEINAYIDVLCCELINSMVLLHSTMLFIFNNITTQFFIHFCFAAQHACSWFNQHGYDFLFSWRQASTENGLWYCKFMIFSFIYRTIRSCRHCIEYIKLLFVQYIKKFDFCSAGYLILQMQFINWSFFH